jgi:Domain of unknown function (DUF4116)
MMESAAGDSMEVCVGAVPTRTHEIEELRREISTRQKRITELRAAHEEHTRKASLLLNAEYEYKGRFAWLPAWLKKKEYVLLALKSERIPTIMRWNSFDAHFSFSLHLDREVLLARLELDDFEAAYDNKLYHVPRRFRRDKEVMMAVCSKNYMALSLASKQLCNDPDVVLAAIRQNHHLAPMAIQYASNKLRADKKVVRVALNREHGIRCVAYIAPKLRQDKRLILTSIRRSSAQCSREYEHLSELPESLCRDEEIVMAALKKRGSNLQYVTAPELLNDLDVALTACKQDVKAFTFVPKNGPTRRELGKAHCLRAIISNGGGSILKCASASSQNNSMLLLAAVANGLNRLDLKHLPSTSDLFREQRSFFMQLLSTNGNLYRTLPVELKKNIDIALECLSSELLNESTALDVVRHHESLWSDLGIMASIAKRGFAAVLKKSPISVRGNKTLMLKACAVHGSLLSLASDRLRNDPEVVSAALTSHPDTVFKLTNPSFFQNNLKVAELAIKVYNGDSDALYKFLPGGLFHHRNVLLAWLGKGWSEDHPFINRNLMTTGGYTDDREVLLAILGQGGTLFDLGCDNLLGDREFLKAAIEVDGRALMQGVNDDLMFDDFDLLLSAVGSSRLTLQPFPHGGTNAERLVGFAARVREQLMIADLFVAEFLRGIAVDVPHVAPALRCQLPKLDHGSDASIKRQIAEYAGIPLGDELRLLRSSSANLEYWGY